MIFTVDANTTVAIICTDGYSHYNLTYHQLAKDHQEPEPEPELKESTSLPPHRSAPLQFIRQGMPYVITPNWTCDLLPVISHSFYPS
jgi:hypothetical protein